MKKTHCFVFGAAIAVACMLGACGWESSGSDDSWTDTPINVSGSYHGTDGYGGEVVHNLPGKKITYLSVQQNGTAVTITDNQGGQYKGKISSGSKSAKGTGGSAIIQYAYNYEVKGVDCDGQYTRLVGTFEAVAEGQRLHDRIISGSWLGTAKNGGIYGVAASVKVSQVENSDVTGSGTDDYGYDSANNGSSSTNSSSSSSSKTNSSSSTYSTNDLHWVDYSVYDVEEESTNQEVYYIGRTGTDHYYLLKIDGGSGEYIWKRLPWKEDTAVGSMDNGSVHNKERKFHPGTKPGTAMVRVTDKVTGQQIFAYITIR